MSQTAYIVDPPFSQRQGRSPRTVRPKKRTTRRPVASKKVEAKSKNEASDTIAAEPAVDDGDVVQTEDMNLSQGQSVTQTQSTFVGLTPALRRRLRQVMNDNETQTLTPFQLLEHHWGGLTQGEIENRFVQMANEVKTSLSNFDGAFNDFLWLKNEAQQHHFPSSFLSQMGLIAGRITRTKNELSVPLIELLNCVLVFAQPWDRMDRRYELLQKEIERRKRELDVSVAKLNDQEAVIYHLRYVRMMGTWRRMVEKLLARSKLNDHVSALAEAVMDLKNDRRALLALSQKKRKGKGKTSSASSASLGVHRSKKISKSHSQLRIKKSLSEVSEPEVSDGNDEEKKEEKEKEEEKEEDIEEDIDIDEEMNRRLSGLLKEEPQQVGDNVGSLGVAAEAGDWNAMLSLAEILGHPGGPLEFNPVQSLLWFRKAALAESGKINRLEAEIDAIKAAHVSMLEDMAMPTPAKEGISIGVQVMTDWGTNLNINREASKGLSAADTSVLKESIPAIHRPFEDIDTHLIDLEEAERAAEALIKLEKAQKETAEAVRREQEAKEEMKRMELEREEKEKEKEEEEAKKKKGKKRVLKRKATQPIMKDVSTMTDIPSPSPSPSPIDMGPLSPSPVTSVTVKSKSSVSVSVAMLENEEEEKEEEHDVPSWQDELAEMNRNLESILANGKGGTDLEAVDAEEEADEAEAEEDESTIPRLQKDRIIESDPSYLPPGMIIEAPSEQDEKVDVMHRGDGEGRGRPYTAAAAHGPGSYEVRIHQMQIEIDRLRMALSRSKKWRDQDKRAEKIARSETEKLIKGLEEKVRAEEEMKKEKEKEKKKQKSRSNASVSLQRDLIEMKNEIHRLNAELDRSQTANSELNAALVRLVRQNEFLSKKTKSSVPAGKLGIGIKPAASRELVRRAEYASQEAALKRTQESKYSLSSSYHLLDQLESQGKETEKQQHQDQQPDQGEFVLPASFLPHVGTPKASMFTPRSMAYVDLDDQ